MNNVKKLIGIIFLGAMISLFSCGEKNNSSSSHEETTVSADGWSCPMKCEGEKSYSEEGKCPVCKMALKKKGDGGAHKHENHEGHDHGSHDGHDHGDHEGHNHN